MPEDQQASESSSVLRPGLLSFVIYGHCAGGPLAYPRPLLFDWRRRGRCMGPSARPTQDFDVVAQVDDDTRERLEDALSAFGMTVDQQWLEVNPIAAGRVARFVSSTYPHYSLTIHLTSSMRQVITNRRFCGGNGP